MNYIFGLILIGFFVKTNPLDLPSGLQTCHGKLANYVDCISEAITDAILSLAQGSKILKIPPLEPLKINKIAHRHHAENPDRLLIRHYKNIEIHGFTKGLKIEYEYISLDSETIRFNAYNEQIDIDVGNYLAIRLSPDGRMSNASAGINITTTDVKTEHAILCERYIKDDEEFLKVRKYKINFRPQHVRYDFYKVDCPEAQSYLAGVSNQSWARMFDEIIRSKLEFKLASYFKNIANKIFGLHPKNVIFPE